MLLKKVVIGVTAFTLLGSYTAQAAVNVPSEMTTEQTVQSNKLFNSTTLTQEQKEFVQKIYKYALKAQTQKGLLPSVTVAQAILESGWGKSSLAAQPNYNLFGIKANTDWTGKTYTKETTEMVNNELIKVVATFRAYDSWEKSVEDYSNFFTSTAFRKTHYQAFRNASNYKEALEKLGETGYATDKSYAQKLLRVVEQYKLYYLDGLEQSLSDNNSSKNDDNNENGKNVENNGTNDSSHLHNSNQLNDNRVNKEEKEQSNVEKTRSAEIKEKVETGIVEQGNQLKLLKKGVVDTAYTGLAQHVNKTWYYVKNGTVDQSYSGLVLYYGTWYNVINGVLDWSYTGIVRHYADSYYVQNGQLHWNVTGFVSVKENNQTDNAIYYLNNSTVLKYTGLMQYPDGTWLYLKNGQFDSSYSGLVMYYGTWYNVNNGVLDWKYTSLVKYDGTWYYVQNGQLNWGKTTLARDLKAGNNSQLYYVTNSTLNTSYTGLAQDESGVWHYVKSGKVDNTYSGLVMYQNKWFNVVSGILDWEYTGLVDYMGTWYYVQNGQLNWGKTALAQKVKDGAHSPYYYVTNSTFNPNYTGLVQHDNQTWYYVVKGVESKAFSGIVAYNGNLFYVKNGKIDWNFSGNIYFNGQQYTIKNAQVLGNQLISLKDRQLTKTVFIDPGHGGSDPGAVNGTLREKEQALLVGQKLKDKLEKLGYTVVMSRMTDAFIGLRERSILSNSSPSDIFISLHFNASGKGTAHGLETYWYDGKGNAAINGAFANDKYRLDESQRLATLIQNNIVNDSKRYNRGVKRQNFSVIRETAVPAVLVEMGFIDHAEEAELIKTDAYLEQMAESISKAVDSYYKTKGN